jgi:peroxiredoxin
VIVISALAALLAIAIWASDNRPPSISKGSIVPELRAVRLDNLEQEVSLTDYRGSVVLLSVWATWCGSCAFSLAEQDSLTRRFRARGLRSIAISVDQPRDSFAARQKLSRVAPDVEGWLDYTRAAKGTLKYRGVPQSYLIGRDGRLVAHIEGVTAVHGEVWNNRRGLAQIEKALSAP